MKINKLFNNIITNNKVGSAKAFGEVIRTKLEDALEVRKVGLTAQIFNKATVKESAKIEEAKLEKPKGTPLEIQNQLGTMIAKAKTIKAISDDEYVSWYGNLDDKTYERWEKMVKADPQYKKAYTLGTQGGSDKPPFPKGTFAAAIWSNEYAAGAMDS